MSSDDSAFPIVGMDHQSLGLTKREYFAGLAMQGLLAADADGDWDHEYLTGWAIKHADALIAELEKSS